MKRILITAVILQAAALMTGCASAFKSSSFSDDLYAIHNKTEIAQRQKAEAELAKAQAEARQAQWEAKIAEAKANAVASGDYTVYEASVNPYDAVLADTYESAYARRLYGFESPSYRMPSSYYTLRYNDAFHYATAYDPAFYNVMVSGNQVWVEPKYITSMFGTWGASVAFPSYGWYNGWVSPYNYAWWGYPHFSWYDWNWGMHYDPWWGFGFGWGWGYPHRPPHHHYPPHYGDGWHRPGGGHRPGGNVVHRPAYRAPSYTGNPSSRPNNGTVRRGGTTTGSGIYRGSGATRNQGTNSSGQYRGQSNNRNNYNNYNDRNDNNSFRQNSTPSYNRGGSSGYSGGYSGGGNSSGMSHGGGQRRR